MKIKVNGKQIDIGDALTSYVEEKLTNGVSKYSARPVDAVVTFSRDAHLFKCDCSAHLSTGLTAQASGSASDIYAAFDATADKIEKQLRRYKRRLKDHHAKRSEPVALFGGSEQVIASSDHDEDSEPETLQPVIIAEQPTAIPSLTVGEAVMQMEMGERPVLVFHNEALGGMNVVYRRQDGNIGWISSAEASRATA